jgi:uncharacterized YigZ family protein
VSDTDVYYSIGKAASATYRDRGSRFIALAFPVDSEQEARDKLEAIRREYHDATHHCYAWRIGPGAEQFRASDAGEPAGTAGLPILNQLKSAGLSDILLVVVRYFGGTKLGSSGLIQAYKSAASLALEQAVRLEKMQKLEFDILFTYPDTQDVSRLISQYNLQILEQYFAGECRYRVSVRQSLAPALIEAVQKMRKPSVIIR